MSENDSWRTLLIPQTGTLYDPTDGQFYHWDGTKLCREPWTGSESVQSSGSGMSFKTTLIVLSVQFADWP